MKLSKR